MSNLFSAGAPEPLKQNEQHRSLEADIDSLKRQLHGFSVMDKDGRRLGEVTDVILDANQRLCLVVTQFNASGSSHSFLLFSHLIRAVSNRTRLVTVKINRDDAHLLPKASIAESRSAVPSTPTRISITESDELSSPKAMAGESQVSTSVAPETATPADPIQTPLSEQMPHSGSAAFDSPQPTQSEPDPLENLSFPLLEERLRVNYNRRKIGEVIVRKTIETRIVEVPVRYEKLLIEQVSPEHRSLAEVNLSQGEIPGLDDVTIVQQQPVVRGEFTSPRVAGQILDTIAKTLHHRCNKVRIELELDDPALLDTYQGWFNQYAQQTSNTSNKIGDSDRSEPPK